jgi:hypothetical protein
MRVELLPSSGIGIGIGTENGTRFERAEIVAKSILGTVAKIAKLKFALIFSVRQFPPARFFILAPVCTLRQCYETS